jgi:xanthine dehydrogenase accessory factor
MTLFYDDFKDAIESGISFALATVVRIHASTPRDPGAKMGVLPDGGTFGTIGGGKLEKLVVDDCMSALESGKPMLKRYSLMPENKGGIGSECGGDVEIFIDVIQKSEKLLIIGAGHVSLAISKIARILGFQIEVVDERADFANKERFPGAIINNSEIDKTDFKSLITPRTIVIIVSRSHEMDKTALGNVVECGAAYVGMIGSKRKVKYIMDSLKKAGTNTDKLEKVYSPIGLDIGAETPEEIALSILGEIISLKRKGISPLSMKSRKSG